jgi:AraC-like DNA-binding protein
MPSFDNWTTIFLFAGMQGVFVSCVMFFINKENRRARFLLASITLLFSITLIEYVLWWTRYIYYLPHFFNISAAFPFLFGPLLFYYFKCVFENYRFSFKDLLVLLPFLINVIDMSSMYFVSSTVKKAWITGGVQIQFFPYWPWIRIVHLIIYFVAIILKFSSISNSQYEVKLWFRYLTVLFAAFIVSYASYYILVLFPWFNVQWDYMISFSMMFTIYFLSWFGYLQPSVFHGFSVVEAISQNIQPQKYRNSPLTSDISSEIARKLNYIMASRKLYRDNDLRLEKLAEETGTTKHYLSQVINEKMGMTFFEYINSMRITEAMLLLSQKSKEELNIIEIAYRVGFNNKVSFNNTFKKIAGMTPTEFRRKQTALNNAVQNN